MALITPEWPVPAHIKSFVTMRAGGASGTPYNGFNLGGHVGDEPSAVAANRAQLANLLSPSRDLVFHWLDQVHSTDVLELASRSGAPASVCCADASITREPRQVSVVMTADCLPLLICDKKGTQVAAVHAGWRGLADGIIGNTIASFSSSPSDLLCYLGPAISQAAFEVGEDVLRAFQSAQQKREYFEDLVLSFSPVGPGKFMADMYRIAKAELRGAGVELIYGGDRCTFTESEAFFSFRRDGVTGRMATGIWIDTQG